ncbi:MAG: DUF5685 family protein, partial [Clostridia bacterium]|nr:DUF5685 family protein [Clostridia bacterium]
LFYYKLLDNFYDSRGLRRLGCRLLQPGGAMIHWGADRRAGDIEQIVAAYLREQRDTERRGAASPDEAADATGKMLSSLMERCAHDDTQRRVYARLGYFLGRWIYFIDAADDLDDDLKSGGYNPFASAFSLKEGSDSAPALKSAEMLLNSCSFEIAAAYELLAKGRFCSIIENIIYLGMPQTQKKVLSGKNKGNKRI